MKDDIEWKDCHLPRYPKSQTGWEIHLQKSLHVYPIRSCLPLKHQKVKRDFQQITIAFKNNPFSGTINSKDQA